MRTIIINSNNLVSNTYNDTYKYSFPVGSIVFKEDQISVSQVTMYYSWNNITSSTTGGQYNNNTFGYYWIDGSLNAVTMPDGYYAIADINAYLQSVMVSNGHYLIDANGNFLYYLTIVINQTYYAIQLNAFPVPTESQFESLNYSLPSNATWSFPSSTAQTPIFRISASNNFKLIIGFSAGNYPSTAQSTSYSIVSNNGVPEVSPVSSLILECSLCNQNTSIPSSLLYSFAPNVSFGEQIFLEPPQQNWIDITDGAFNEFTITFKDQNLNRVQILDSNIVILLTIRNKKEYLTK